MLMHIAEGMGYLPSGPYETGVEEERHRTCLAAPAHPCARGIPFILNISES